MKRTIILLFALIAMTSYCYSQQNNVILPQRPKTHSATTLSFKDNGFWMAAEAEGASSVMIKSTTDMQFVGLTFTAGYRINEFLRFGAGLGARVYVHNADFRKANDVCAIPLFFNVRGNFISKQDRSAAPYWSVNIGGIPKEGFYLNPTLGYSFGGLRNNFVLGLSYSLNTFKDLWLRNQAYSYLGLKLGYEF